MTRDLAGNSSIICTIKFEINCGGEGTLLRTFNCVEFVFGSLEWRKLKNYFVGDLYEALIILTKIQFTSNGDLETILQFLQLILASTLYTKSQSINKDLSN